NVSVSKWRRLFF
ncbi:MAG TPA: hypothetical protein DCM53_09050, partial [Enterobacteriaceae bacterium]|nr:hypothetical protein [Enterobacteriaceae bacterium]